MRLFIITLLSLGLTSIGCNDSDEPLQGWKESEVEIVSEGEVRGTTDRIVHPGDATAMTATSIDTTTDLDMITDQQLGLENGEQNLAEGGEWPQRSLAERFDPQPGEASREPAARPPSAHERPVRTTTQPASPRPSTSRQSRPEPSEPTEEQRGPAPRPADQDEREPEDEREQEEDLPPIVVPPPEPEPPSDDRRDPSPPPTDTSPTDTAPDPDREPDPPDDEEPDDESE